MPGNHRVHPLSVGPAADNEQGQAGTAHSPELPASGVVSITVDHATARRVATFGACVCAGLLVLVVGGVGSIAWLAATRGCRENCVHVGGDSVNHGLVQALGNTGLEKLKICECVGNEEAEGGSAACCCSGLQVQCCTSVGHGLMNESLVIAAAMSALAQAEPASTGPGIPTPGDPDGEFGLPMGPSDDSGGEQDADEWPGTATVVGPGAASVGALSGVSTTACESMPSGNP